MCFEDVYRQSQLFAQAAQHRQLLWLSGEAQWCYAQLGKIAPQLLNTQSVGVFNKAQCKALKVCDRQITNRECQRYLGQEVQAIVYDAFAGFNPDSLSIISGTLVAGGVLVLMTPAAENWQHWNDPELDNLWVQPYHIDNVQRHFLKWVLASLMQDQHLIQYTEHSLTIARQDSMKPQSSPVKLQAIDEQKLLVQKCANYLLTNTLSSVVLTAPRGRGKSAALGLLANELTRQRSLFLTASDTQAVLQVQKFSNSDIGFYSPAQLLADDFAIPLPAVLMVDEAASISVDVLVRLLHKFPQCIFSTTTDGYEGTGQGFKLRFLKYLAANNNPCQLYELTKPMRWAENDPIESWLNKAFLLAMTDHSPKELNRKNEWLVAKIESKVLIETPLLLDQLYTLLAQAHYRTTPSDLRIILDSPNMHLWLTRLNGEIVAACLVAEEGPIDAFEKDPQGYDARQLVQAIYRGQRRPRGNLIPQILIGQEGELAAGAFKFARVVRIATVHSQRRKALASQLLETVASWAQKNHFDYLSANFSVDQGLLTFWQQSGFCIVRVGNQQDKVTASYNAMSLKPLSSDCSLQQRLAETLAYKLTYQRQRLTDISLIADRLIIEQQCPPFEQYVAANSQYLSWCIEQLQCFAHYFRPLESIGYIVAGLLNRQRQVSGSVTINARYQQLLEDYFIKHTALDKLYVQYSLSGYRSLVKELRYAVKALLTLLEKGQ